MALRRCGVARNDRCPEMKKILLAWSGGKDSALALHEIREGGELGVAALLTTVGEDYDRVSMHGVRRELLESQVRALGYPLETVLIPGTATNETYETRMRTLLEKWARRGVTGVAFGDLATDRDDPLSPPLPRSAEPGNSTSRALSHAPQARRRPWSQLSPPSRVPPDHTERIFPPLPC